MANHTSMWQFCDGQISANMDRFAFVEYSTPAEALAACKGLDGVPLDKKHTLRVNKLTDIDRFGREGRIDEHYTAPKIEEFQEKEHLRSWLADPSGRGRDQFVMYTDDQVRVLWNNEKDAPESIVDRQHWTESFVQWSPQGTYLTSMHQQGVQLWGGPSWTRQKRFPHPFVNLVDFSPGEKYITTWSNRPISIPEEGHPALSVDDDGKNYVIWDIETGKPLRSFANIDLPSNANDEAGQPIKRKIVWPAFKWSADDQYVARLTQGSSISVYELPRMGLLDKTSIKIEGVMDFDWAPASPHREGVKTYEQLFCYWTPEIGSNPAKVGLMSIPSKEVVRTLNLFSVTDAKLHWQSDASYLCVKVDRHSKSKKSLATSLEIFRVREKGVPVEVVDSIKDTVINFAWEPKGDRFVIITTAEVVAPSAVPPKTSVSFYCPEKVKGAGVGNFKHIRTYDKKNSNAIYWSPKGRFVIVATVHSQQSFDMEFFDLDFEGEKPESEKDLTANLQLMNTADHYGVTDIDWDPTGRFVATSASIWKHTVSQMHTPSHEFTLIILDRWKTATTCTTSRASSCARSPSRNSSNGCGAHAHPRYSQRKSRSSSARTSANTARSSSKKIPTVVRQPTWLSWSTGEDCWKSGFLGERAQRRMSRRSVKREGCRWIHWRISWVRPMRARIKLLRRSWRRLWKRLRRLFREVGDRALLVDTGVANCTHVTRS